MILAALLLLQAGAPAAADMDERGTITVTARRLSDLAGAVAACKAATCPPRQDVAVSVAYASALFDQGQYRKAKAVLGTAVGRVKRAAAAEPLAVSVLYNAQATLSFHDGDLDDARIASRRSYLVLRDNVGATALPTLSAGYRMAQMLLRDRRFVEADTQFSRIARAATAGGHRTLADACDLHRAQMLVLRDFAPEGFALLEAVAAREPGPDGDADMQRAALATALRLATDRGEDTRADAYAARLAALGAGDEPLLLVQGPAPVPLRGADGVPVLRWVDIGYWIQPDGSVDEVEVLRGSRTRGWEGPLLEHVAGRRYAPTRGSVGQYRVERYTLTGVYAVPSDSHIRKRGGARFEMMPMTGARPTSL